MQSNPNPMQIEDLRNKVKLNAKRLLDLRLEPESGTNLMMISYIRDDMLYAFDPHASILAEYHIHTGVLQSNKSLKNEFEYARILYAGESVIYYQSYNTPVQNQKERHFENKIHCVGSKVAPTFQDTLRLTKLNNMVSSLNTMWIHPVEAHKVDPSWRYSLQIQNRNYSRLNLSKKTQVQVPAHAGQAEWLPREHLALIIEMYVKPQIPVRLKLLDVHSTKILLTMNVSQIKFSQEADPLTMSDLKLRAEQDFDSSMLIDYALCSRLDNNVYFVALRASFKGMHLCLVYDLKRREEVFTSKYKKSQCKPKYPLFFHKNKLYVLCEEKSTLIRSYDLVTGEETIESQLDCQIDMNTKVLPYVVDSKVKGIFVKCRIPQKRSLNPSVISEEITLKTFGETPDAIPFSEKKYQIVNIHTSQNNQRVLFSFIYSWKLYPLSHVIGIEYDVAQGKFIKLLASSEQNEMFIASRDTTSYFSQYRNPEQDKFFLKEWKPDGRLQIIGLGHKTQIIKVFETNGKLYFLQPDCIQTFSSGRDKLEIWHKMKECPYRQFFDLSTCKQFFIVADSKDLYSISIASKTVTKIYNGDVELQEFKKQADGDYLYCMVRGSSEVQILALTESKAAKRETIDLGALGIKYPSLLGAVGLKELLVSTYSDEEKSPCVVAVDVTERSITKKVLFTRINSTTDPIFTDSGIIFSDVSPVMIRNNIKKHLAEEFIDKYIKDEHDNSPEAAISVLEHMLYNAELHNLLKNDINALDYAIEFRNEKLIIKSLKILGTTPNPFRLFTLQSSTLKSLVEKEILEQLKDKNSM